jgi:hypothetical protein
VYVYTNSRVLNQNVPFTDEAATEWYRQTVVFEDFDFEGPADFYDDYDNVSDFDTPNMAIDDELSKGNQKNKMGYNSKLRESEKMDGTFKTGLHTM